MKRILTYLRPYLGLMMLGFSMKAVGALMELGIPWLLAYMIDDIIPLGNLKWIFLCGGGMLFLTFATRQSNVTANQIAAKVGRNAIEDIRHDLFTKIETLSCSQVDGFSVPSLISRMTTDTYNIHQVIGIMQRMGVRAPIMLIGGILVTFTLEPVLAMILVILIPIASLFIYLISKKGMPMYGKLQGSVDAMVRTVREDISGIRVIKALSKTEYEKKRFGRVNDTVSDKELEAGITMALLSPMVNLIFNLGMAMAILVGAYRVNAGVTEAGKIVAFLSYFTMMLQSVMAINRIFLNLSKATASAARIDEVLSEKEDLSKRLLPEGDQEQHIQFKNVSFQYNKAEDVDKEEKSCINKINFSLKKGESLGIIGSTGCGKTTLINLLMRFYDVDEGAIYIDGIDIRSYDIKELRDKFGVVFQNDVIFSDTIAENIRFERDINREEIMSSAEYAQAMAFIEEKEEGFEYKIASKGSNLSGGQKQRLLIGRALAGSPEILILDDSSSALDYKTDALVRHAITAHYKGTTTIMIAQRISSIMSLDHIMVLEEGKINGYGTHEELLNECEIYQEIYRLQMGGETYAS